MNEYHIRQIFVLSVLLKGAHAVIECVGGLALAIMSTKTIAALVNMITEEELIGDPHDFIATHLRTLSQDLSVSSAHFLCVLSFKPRCCKDISSYRSSEE